MPLDFGPEPPAGAQRIPSFNQVHRLNDVVYKRGVTLANGRNWLQLVECPVLASFQRKPHLGMPIPEVLHAVPGNDWLVTKFAENHVRLPSLLFNAGAVRLHTADFERLGTLVAHVQNAGTLFVRSNRPGFIYNKASGIFNSPAELAQTSSTLPATVEARNALLAANGMVEESQVRQDEFLAHRGFIHGDLSWENILMPTEEEQSPILLDWEFSAWADPAWDIGRFITQCRRFRAILATTAGLALPSDWEHQLARCEATFWKSFASAKDFRTESPDDFKARVDRQLPYHLLRLGQTMTSQPDARRLVLKQVLELRVNLATP